MAIEPVKIPQNVYVEDRIIGPITLKQIMIVMGSSGLSYAIWAMVQSAGGTTPVHTFLSWTPTMIGIAFAFVKINGISLFRILLLAIERIDKPAKRVWMPRRGIYVNIVTVKSQKHVKEKTQEETRTKEQSEIEELSRLLDEGPKQQEESEQMKAVRPERITAEKRRKPVDDIQKAPNYTESKGLIRDITPPNAHGK